jgi:mRNA-degrading endonuclease RelE of RelBE toxin-antitoxin system
MLTVEYTDDLLKTVRKIKDTSVKEKIKKHIAKIIECPEIGKPMRYARKGTRELYIGSYRLAYTYFKEEKKIILLDLYHKDEQ